MHVWVCIGVCACMCVNVYVCLVNGSGWQLLHGQKQTCCLWIRVSAALLSYCPGLISSVLQLGRQCHYPQKRADFQPTEWYSTVLVWSVGVVNTMTKSSWEHGKGLFHLILQGHRLSLKAARIGIDAEAVEECCLLALPSCSCSAAQLCRDGAIHSSLDLPM